MARLRVGPNFTIFALFFGAALLESVRHGDWLMAVIFIALAVLFMLVEPAPRSERPSEPAV